MTAHAGQNPRANKCPTNTYPVRVSVTTRDKPGMMVHVFAGMLSAT